MTGCRFIAAALAAMLACWPVSAKPAFAGKVKISVEGAARIAERRGEGCAVRLRHAADGGHFDYRNDCEVALADKLAALTDLAEALGVGGGTIRSLGIGRLIRYPELARRLALSAYKATNWDTGAGRPAGSAAGGHGAANRFVAARLLNRRLLVPFAEAAAGRLDGIEVEKVLVGSPTDMPFADWLKANGVGAEAKLPYDAIIWLTFRDR
jgi:hypothetical protein